MHRDDDDEGHACLPACLPTYQGRGGKVLAEEEAQQVRLGRPLVHLTTMIDGRDGWMDGLSEW